MLLSLRVEIVLPALGAVATMREDEGDSQLRPRSRLVACGAHADR
jgi:hypothetical protein